MTISNTATVVAPRFNPKKYIDDALLGVRNQTHAALDIIAVDGGFTDETPQLLHRHVECDPGVRVVHRPNGGLPAARNAGQRQARGEFVCFLDADDVILPGKIEKQVRFPMLFSLSGIPCLETSPLFGDFIDQGEQA